MDKKEYEELITICRELKQDFKDLRKIIKEYFKEAEKDTNEFDNLKIDWEEL